MQITPTKLPEVLLIIPKSFGDPRGKFAETYKKSTFQAIGLDIDFLQDNRSASVNINTIRGLHYQIPPFAQTKLVSVQHGRIWDVAIDLRRSSPTFGQHIAFELTAEGGEQLFIPTGFAHGFCTLEPNTVVTYKVDQYYAPAHEGGLHWRAPELAIPWPCGADEGHLSPKDAILPDRIDQALCFD